MRHACIVAPVRTPVGAFGGALRSVGVEVLAATVVQAVLERSRVDPSSIDDVVFAQSYANGETPCIGRWASIRRSAMPGRTIRALRCCRELLRFQPAPDQ